MNLDAKKAVQGAFFDILVALDPTVGEVMEISLGVAFMTLVQHHQGDVAAASAGLRECVRQMLEQAPQIQRAPMAIVPGGKLDS